MNNYNPLNQNVLVLESIELLRKKIKNNEIKSLLITYSDNIKYPKKQLLTLEEAVRYGINQLGTNNIRCLINNEELITKAKKFLGGQSHYIKIKKATLDDLLTITPSEHEIITLDLMYHNQSELNDCENEFMKLWHGPVITRGIKAINYPIILKRRELIISDCELRIIDPLFYRNYANALPRSYK